MAPFQVDWDTSLEVATVSLVLVSKILVSIYGWRYREQSIAVCRVAWDLVEKQLCNQLKKLLIMLSYSRTLSPTYFIQ